MEPIRITYLGHACFELACKGQSVVVDPYADGMVPGLEDLRIQANAVYCSHEHDDHNNRAAVTLEECAVPAWSVRELDTPHDDRDGALRGRNTVRVFAFGGASVAHLGDLGRALTEQEAAMLTGVDCLLLPVGGFYTIDAATAAQTVRQLQPRVAIPMHYRTEKSGFDKIAKLESFTEFFDNVTCTGRDTVWLPDVDTNTKILVLNARNEGV